MLPWALASAGLLGSCCLKATGFHPHGDAERLPSRSLYQPQLSSERLHGKGLFSYTALGGLHLRAGNKEAWAV